MNIALAAHDAIGLIFLVCAALAAAWGYWLSCIDLRRHRKDSETHNLRRQTLRRYAAVNSRFLS